MKTTQISNRKAFLTAAILLFTCLTAPAQDYRVLHHFAGGANDGSAPVLGALIQSGSILYGMTGWGGSNDLGTVFRLNTDGTGFEVLHSFVSPATDGQDPYGSLLLSGSILYGLAAAEHSAQAGTLFKLNTDGSDFQVLHTFSGAEGKWPYDSLIQDGSVLYGMCTYGGNNTGSGWVGSGTIFKVNTDGTEFHLLRTFTGGDGSGPHGSLIQSGSTLYGTTLAGGGSSLGTIFKINTNGTGFQTLRHFTGGTADGSAPYGTTLVQSGAALYGMTQFGGSTGNGTIFRINTNGAGFQLLRSFAGGANDGYRPMCGTLVLSGSTLYGMTTSGGIGNTNGVVFQIQTNGTGFKLLHRFNGGDGREPWGSLLLSGSTLYGMTIGGGSNNLGVIFAVDLLPKVAISLDATNMSLSWSTNFPGFALESSGQLTGAWAPVPGVTGYSATLPVNLEANQFFRLRRCVAYLGQKPPGNIPEVFAPHLIDTNKFEIHSSLCFSPDNRELYYSLYPLERRGAPHVIICVTMGDKGDWTTPKPASFSGHFSDDGPSMTPDGKRLFYCSNRSLDGLGEPRPMQGWNDHDIWYVERTNSTWGSPIHAGSPLNTGQMEIYPSVSASGNLYFGGYVANKEFGMGLKMSPLNGGRYAAPILLGSGINSPSMDWCPFVAPDESYLIFSSKRVGGDDWGDLYVSFRKSDRTWSEPVSMGHPINTSRQERFPSVSPDGKYLFFVRHATICWVDAKVISAIKSNLKK